MKLVVQSLRYKLFEISIYISFGSKLSLVLLQKIKILIEKSIWNLTVFFGFQVV